MELFDMFYEGRFSSEWRPFINGHHLVSGIRMLGFVANIIPNPAPYRFSSIAAELKADIYFAHPYHSWERGLNENSNGLLRQYFPKWMELIDLAEERVQQAVDRLNHRPRKVLGFRTPHEVFFGLKMRYTNTPLTVALRT